MSSKPAAEAPRPWSVARRLTIWYTAAGFALVLGATSYLYWGLARNMDYEDDEFLADRVGAVRRVLTDRPDDPAAVRQEVLAGGADRGGRFFIRVGAGPDAVETPGMTEVLPPGVFPKVGAGGHEPAADYRAADGRLFRLLTSRDAASKLIIHGAMDRTHDDHLLSGYRRRLGLALGVSLIAAAVGGYAIARHGLQPIADVSAAARRIGPAGLGERIVTTGLPAEVRDLAETFNAMLARLQDAFARLGRFSADIAHELRTPLNNLRGEAEVALRRPRTPEEYQEVLGSCLEECGRLARLVDGLLFLARADDARTVLVRSPVDVAAELCAVRDVFGPAAAEAGVRLEVDAEPGLVLNADQALMQQAVGNLVSNAMAHTPAGGTVTLFAAPGRVGVRDTGSGIAAEHLPFVFDRFYRADPARASSGGRAGLGLAIVRGIAELHGGTATAVSEPGKGTTITLTFPVSG